MRSARRSIAIARSIDRALATGLAASKKHRRDEFAGRSDTAGKIASPSRHRASPQTRERQDRKGHYYDPHGHEADRHNGFLPGLTAAAYCGNWGHRSRAEDCRECGHRPISVRAIQRTPVRSALQSRREPHVRPDYAQRDEERSIHHTFQVGGEPHTRVTEVLLDKAGEETQQEQEHSVPDQSTLEGIKT